jgi:hypothetical protein
MFLRGRAGAFSLLGLQKGFDKGRVLVIGDPDVGQQPVFQEIQEIGAHLHLPGRELSVHSGHLILEPAVDLFVLFRVRIPGMRKIVLFRAEMADGISLQVVHNVPARGQEGSPLHGAMQGIDVGAEHLVLIVYEFDAGLQIRRPGQQAAAVPGG